MSTFMEIANFWTLQFKRGRSEAEKMGGVRRNMRIKVVANQNLFLSVLH